MSASKETISANLNAFLDMIATSEGTINRGDQDGYNVIVGGTLFEPYTEHPNVLVDLGHGLKSTAAGRYQLLHKYWLAYRDQLALPDFSPASQDLIAIQQIRERHALVGIGAGKFDEAVAACSNIWASLPGAGYGQHENTLATLRDAYTGFGGSLAA